MSDNQLNADNWCETSLTQFKTSIHWTINDFSRLPVSFDKSIKSTAFGDPNDGQRQWFLEIYPNGKKHEEKGHFESVFVYLRVINYDEIEIQAFYELQLIDLNGKVGLKWGRQDKTYEWSKRLTHDFSPLTIEKNEMNGKQLLTNDKLTVYCKLKYYLPKSIGGQFICSKLSERTLAYDMTQLHSSLKESDVMAADLEIAFADKVIRAHKLLLMARSSVFKAMLSYDMIEQQNNQIFIEDIESEVFEAMLKFIYTDIIDNKTIEFSIKLFYAAEKYELNGLKSKCQEFIGKNLTVETVCDVLIFADMHSATDLKTYSLYFIKHNINKVKETESWKTNAEQSIQFRSLCNEFRLYF